MREKPSRIEWPSLPLWSARQLDGAFVVKVADTSIETHVIDRRRERNLTFEIHATEAKRTIGYRVRPLRSIEPDVAFGRQYLGVFYSGVEDLDARDSTVEVLYHDQYVRFIAFGSKRSSRDYMLVLRNRSE